MKTVKGARMLVCQHKIWKITTMEHVRASNESWELSVCRAHSLFIYLCWIYSVWIDLCFGILFLQFYSLPIDAIAANAFEFKELWPIRTPAQPLWTHNSIFENAIPTIVRRQIEPTQFETNSECSRPLQLFLSTFFRHRWPRRRWKKIKTKWFRMKNELFIENSERRQWWGGAMC